MQIEWENNKKVNMSLKINQSKQNKTKKILLTVSTVATAASVVFFIVIPFSVFNKSFSAYKKYDTNCKCHNLSIRGLT